LSIWAVALILAGLMSATLAFVFLLLRLPASKDSKTVEGALAEKAENDVEHIFNEDFREELRNRGRLHFEKIIGENSMFLQQDLRLTTSQLNEYMKSEITRKLQEEFARYEQSINDAKNLATESISKTQTVIEQQRQVMSQQMAEDIKKEKVRILQHFQDNMADIVNHYVLAAVGDQIDLNDQLEFILGQLEANKKDIIEDINRGS